MLPMLFAFPVLGLAIMLQTAIVSRINLLAGGADLMLLILTAWALQERVTTAWHWAALAGFLTASISGLPWFVPVIGYLLVVAGARLLQRRIWQAPLLAMFAVTFAGTLAMHVLSLIVLRLSGVPLPLEDSFTLITLPSVLLNLILAVPVHTLIRDLAEWLHPVSVEV